MDVVITKTKKKSGKQTVYAVPSVKSLFEASEKFAKKGELQIALVLTREAIRQNNKKVKKGCR